MKVAYCLIRDLPHYRRHAFDAGLSAAGFSLLHSTPVAGRDHRGNVLVIWNRYGGYHDIATQFERGGGLVIVAENGFVGKDENGLQYYSLALDGQNGSGRWVTGEEPRFPLLGFEIKPWREPTPTGHIIIRGQRGIGRSGVASPPDWHNAVARGLRTHRKVLVVEHPGVGAVTDKKHEQYLQGAHALIIWSSAVGVKALIAGIPVICHSPYWVCKHGAASASELEAEASLTSAQADLRKREALERMAWAQWSLAEIESGRPFALLYDYHHKKEEAVA